jgi:hypothetical protein
MMVALAVISSVLLQTGLPPYPERTPVQLYSKLGVCKADLEDAQTFINSLVTEIKKRDEEIKKLTDEPAK